MRHLILASVLYLAGTAGLSAQEKPELLKPPAFDPADPFGLKNPQTWLSRDFPASNALALTGKLPSVPHSKVCSVPLLEARVKDIDRGIARIPWQPGAAMPQARLPAPACSKP